MAKAGSPHPLQPFEEGGVAGANGLKVYPRSEPEVLVQRRDDAGKGEQVRNSEIAGSRGG